VRSICITGFLSFCNDFLVYEYLAYNNVSDSIIIMKLNHADTLETFRRLCHKNSIAATHQRHEVYQCVMDSKDHPTPEQICERVRREFPLISVATVYKCLHTFIDAGLLKAASLHHGSLRVEANLRRHHHLVCKICGSMTDLAEEEVAPPRILGPPPHGFQVEEITVDLVGTCAACQRVAR
jgi:Fur family transcriptional regulator, peroxide stress response regulator